MLRYVLYLCLSSLAAGGLLAGDVLFSVTDPRGDDHGSGSILYPANANYADGDLDLVRFEARADRKGTMFRVVFANKVRVVGNRTSRDSPEPLTNFLRHDFFNLNVDIYIDTDGVPGSGNATSLPGRRIQLHEQTRWEKTVCLTPRPPEARSLLKDYLLKARRQQERSLRGNLDRATSRAIKGEVETLLADEFFFPRRIRVRGNSIEFLVPHQFLGGKAQPDWRYLVVVTGSDPEQRLDWSYMGFEGIARGLMILPLARGRSIEQFGLELDADAAQPPIIDVLYPTAAFQKRMLSSFDVSQKQLAQMPALPMVPWNKSLTVGFPGTPNRNTVSLHVQERVAVSNRREGEKPAAQTDTKPPERGQGKPVITRSDVVKQNIKPPAPKPIRPIIKGDKLIHTRSDTVVKGTEKTQSQVDALLESLRSDEKPTRSVAERLRELKELLNQELITQEEYQALRQKILADL